MERPAGFASEPKDRTHDLERGTEVLTVGPSETTTHFVSIKKLFHISTWTENDEETSKNSND